MSRIILITLVALSAVFSGMAQQTKILTAEKHNEYGLVYSLPVTALRITVTARKVTKKAGPYRQYAKKYLGLTDVVNEDATDWQLKDIEITPFGVKDDDTQYLMQLKAGATTYIGVAADGMLLSINAEPVEEETAFEEPKSGSTVLSSGGDVNSYLDFVDMDFVSAQNSMRQAEMLAGNLMDGREAYDALSQGTSENIPTDSRQFEIMLKSIAEKNEAMKRAFSGSETVEEFVTSYVFIPEEEGEVVLFRMSDFNGMVDSDDYSGRPVYIKTEIVKEGTLPLDVNGEEKKFPKDGVVYAIPGSAKITLSTEREKLISRVFDFSQFGTTFGLAPALFTDKKAPSYARFNPVTGALMEIGKVE